MKKGMICLMLFVAAGWLVTGCGDEEKESTPFRWGYVNRTGYNGGESER